MIEIAFYVHGEVRWEAIDFLSAYNFYQELVFLGTRKLNKGETLM